MHCYPCQDDISGDATAFESSLLKATPKFHWFTKIDIFKITITLFCLWLLSWGECTFMVSPCKKCYNTQSKSRIQGHNKTISKIKQAYEFIKHPRLLNESASSSRSYKWRTPHSRTQSDSLTHYKTISFIFKTTRL